MARTPKQRVDQLVGEMRALKAQMEAKRRLLRAATKELITAKRKAGK